MIKKFRELNPNIPFFSVFDKEFLEYGRILDCFDTEAIIAAAEAIPMAEHGTVYTPSEPTFETLPIAKEICERVFGTLPAQLGYCYGKNSDMNALEWHADSELNIAVTPLVLILGKRCEIEDGDKFDSSKVKAFYLPRGTVIECYATSLHYCPCQTEDGGFRSVVGLPKNTNTPLETPTSDPLLFAKNKWIIAHEDYEALTGRGVLGGIYGVNHKINY
jgi:hypothetical protein